MIVAQWVLFVVLMAATYTGISLFGQLSGGSNTALSSFLAALRPLPLALVVLSNMCFGLGLYYGFGATRYALPVAFAIGVIVSFVYSVVVFGAEITLLKVAGAAVIIAGIFMVSL